MDEIVLAHLIENEKYARKVLPYLNEELFYENNQKALFRLVDAYIQKYNTLPTRETLYVDLSNQSGLSEDVFRETRTLIQGLDVDPTTKFEWLIDQTEIFVQDRNIQNALRKSISLLDNTDRQSKDAIPELLREALAVSFDSQIGHDFLDDTDTRFDNYHTHQSRIRFNLDYLNRITGGGLPIKTLSCILAATGVGKSMAMCSMAAGNLMDQKNVLYITLEMAEERIAQRIDANLLDVTMDELMKLTKAQFDTKIDVLKRSTKGKLIVKEYPTASAGAGHFRHLINELRIKKNFMPDIIYIDYINLCTSSRIRGMAGVNSYTYIKAIAEELRGLAVEFKVPIMTATQANRSAYGSSDIDIDNTSDSIGLPMTLDLMIGLTSSDELEELNQLMIKQLKNRLGDPSINRRFVVGVNKAKMRLYDVEESEQEDIMDGPVMDKTTFGEKDETRTRKFSSDKFTGFQ